MVTDRRIHRVHLKAKSCGVNIAADLGTDCLPPQRRATEISARAFLGIHFYYSVRMPRPPVHDTLDLLRAARDIVAEKGPNSATITAIATASGAPVGSIYYRFASRELLLAELWLQTVEQFQRGFISALNGKVTATRGLDAALFTPRWVRQHPKDARVLILHRREDVVSDDWPVPVRYRADALGGELSRGLRNFTRKVFGTTNRTALRKTTLAVVDVPYAAVRRHIAVGEAPPAMLDELIANAYRAIMAED
jgi:AcrR family transcriptional regulator